MADRDEAPAAADQIRIGDVVSHDPGDVDDEDQADHRADHGPIETATRAPGELRRNRRPRA